MEMIVEEEPGSSPTTHADKHGASVRIIVESRRGGEASVASVIEPMSLGVPFPRGCCSDETRLGLSDGLGRPVPLQVRTLGRWADGSIKWALVDFQHQGLGQSQYLLTWSGPSLASPVNMLQVTDEPDGGVSVDTGVSSFRLTPGGRFPFNQACVDGNEVLDAAGTQLVVEDGEGRLHGVRIDTVTVEETGPLRAVVLAKGAVVRGRSELLNLIVRFTFFAGFPTARLALTLRNPRRADHRGGFWDLGDQGSVLLRDVSLITSLRQTAGDNACVFCSPEPQLPFDSSAGALDLYQDSSGGEHWMSPVHLNREGTVPNRFRGYRLSTAGRIEREGLRATPHVVVGSGDAWASVAVNHFWQNCPKAIEADRRQIVLRLWPRQYADLHELQGGEQKTHVVYVSLGAGAPDFHALDWCRRRSIPRAEPSWYCPTGAVPYLTAASEDGDRDYLQLVASAIEGPHSFEHKRESVDEYGWRHFGDIYADHEAVFHQGPGIFVSHYNNQYDALAGFAFHFMRSGDTRWWQAMEELAAHIVDIDVYHTDQDRAPYNHGLFWHTCHYASAERSTHRSYSSSGPTQGGGPASEHNYATGLVMHHYLTGDAVSKETALGLARWVVDMDDGERARFHWLAKGDTGWASQSASLDYQGPGRGAANSINVLLDAHQLTGGRQWIAKAEQLIRRCIHPLDDIDARNLPDVEQRWSYTVFLQALGRYLHHKHEWGEVDDMYAYAQASLLAYARWMLKHEGPYLDRPDILEYPNETWAAQDIRKADVFAWAAAHSAGVDRNRFKTKSDFFFKYSTSTLAASHTATLVRPVVILLTNGVRRAGFERQLPAYPAAALPKDLAAPERFEAQKFKILRRLKIAAVIAGAGTLVGLGTLIVWLL